MSVQRCQHIKTNGQQCGSPAMRAATVCYFHGSLGHTQHLTINQAGYYPSPSPETLTLPVLEDYESVQMAIMQVLQKLTTGHLDRKTAGLLLYGLQIASSNLRYARFDPRAETVVIDVTSTHLTPLDGDQWSDDEEEENYDEEDDDGEGDDQEDLNEELGDDAELEKTEAASVETGLRPVSECSAGIPAREGAAFETAVTENLTRAMRAPSPCASSVGAASSPPAAPNKSAAGVAADASVRAERGRPQEQSQPQKQQPPRISDAQFFQAMANLADHVENGTPLKFPVYPARPPEPRNADISGREKRPPATVGSATDGNGKEKSGG